MTFGAKGWECPVCGRGVAPWQPECSCRKSVLASPLYGPTCNHEWGPVRQDTRGSYVVCKKCWKEDRISVKLSCTVQGLERGLTVPFTVTP